MNVQPPPVTSVPSPDHHLSSLPCAGTKGFECVSGQKAAVVYILPLSLFIIIIIIVSSSELLYLLYLLLLLLLLPLSLPLSLSLFL